MNIIRIADLHLIFVLTVRNQETRVKAMYMQYIPAYYSDIRQIVEGYGLRVDRIRDWIKRSVETNNNGRPLDRSTTKEEMLLDDGQEVQYATDMITTC